MNKKYYLIIGYFLFTLFILQHIFDLRWAWLLDYQNDQMFKRWSGLLLCFIIVFQWTLSLSRTKQSWMSKSETLYNIHTWLGALSPLFFYIHSMYLGYAYLMILTITFFGNFILGTLNLDTIKAKSNWYFQGWMVSHVAISLLITMLSFYHIWIVFYYK